jgi:hypothetical protein
MAQITYDDKVALYENNDIADINKVKADDMNEIKNTINGINNGTDIVDNLVVGVANAKNLFDKNNVVKGWGLYSNGNITAATARCTMMKYIKIDNTKKYILSTLTDYTSTSGYALSIGEYDSSLNFIQRDFTNNSKQLVITPTASTEYVLITGAIVGIDELQFEEGETRSTYTRYQNIGSEEDQYFWWEIPSTLYGTFEYYGSGGVPAIMKKGNTVYIQGVLKPTVEIAVNTSATLFTLPEGCRPQRVLHFICQGSSTKRWLLQINTTGTVTVGRYGASAAEAIPTSSWLPFYASFPLE